MVARKLGPKWQDTEIATTIIKMAEPNPNPCPQDILKSVDGAVYYLSLFHGELRLARINAIDFYIAPP